MGAIALSERPQLASWLARDLGANRQIVQRIVNDLERDGLVTLQPNPDHRRAHLVVLTDKGRKAYDGVLASYIPKAETLTDGLTEAEIRIALFVLTTLHQRLTDDLEQE